ncbi:MAG: ATP-binding cassette domain-containing protein [Limisphaerales bacterium]
MNSTLSNAAPVIAMRGVTVGSLAAPGLVVAREVEWTVAAGEFWAVAGLHGAGKSDFLMLTAGLMAPLAGEYEFLGERMPIFAEERLAHRLRLGLVFEDARLFNTLTVAENIALPLRYHRPAAAVAGRVEQLLEALELTPFADSRPGQLGRNWQRRAALARALALGPEVLCVDNPLAGLDQRQRRWWLELLAALADGHPLNEGRPLTLVVSADGLRAWRGVARQFALLENRQFTVLGDWAGVEQSGHALVRELRGAREAGFDPRGGI